MCKDVLLLLLILSSFILITGCSPEFHTDSVCINEECFEVDVADTDAKRQYGLMFREELSERDGMLFIFEKADNYGFWMKNTLVPLDIIWVDANKEIIFIKKNAQPCEEESCPVFKPKLNASYVLEIKGGMCDELFIAEGDRVDIDI